MLKVNNMRGATLVELMVALGVFTVFMALLFPSFTFLTQQMSTMNDQEMINQRGDRVINYLSEELRMIGFLTGANPGITFCGEANVNALTHTDGDPYDSITFMTSVPVIPTPPGPPTFNLTANAASGAGSITVNTARSNVSTSYISIGAGTNNAKALITFDTLSPTILTKVYEVTGFTGTGIDLGTTNMGTGLAQALNSGSQIYSVRRKQLSVNADRDLRISGWDINCEQASMTDSIYPALGADNEDAGIDGLQFEYLIQNPNTGVVATSDTITTNADRSNLKAVIIYALIRAEFPSRDFEDTEDHIIGTVNPVTLNFSGDAVAKTYRRVLLIKTVEVKNLVF